MPRISGSFLAYMNVRAAAQRAVQRWLRLQLWHALEPPALPLHGFRSTVSSLGSDQALTFEFLEIVLVKSAGFNQSYFCDPSMDAAQAAALDTYARPQRSQAYARIQAALARGVPLDFLWWPKQIQAVNPDLRGFDPSPVIETWNAWQWSI